MLREQTQEELEREIEANFDRKADLEADALVNGQRVSGRFIHDNYEGEEIAEVERHNAEAVAERETNYDSTL
jgi:hypothetical protein